MNDHDRRRLADLERRAEHDRVQSGTSSVIVARAATAAAQSIANATTTIIDYGTVTFDPQTRITTGAAWKFTAALAGYYAVNASILLSPTATWAAGETGNLRLYKNGAFVSQLDRKDNFSGATAQLMSLHGSDLIFLVAGDSINIRVLQDTGGALALHTDAAFNYVTIARV